MNIKEIAEQAGIAVWGDAVYMYDPKDTLDSTVMTKFAELVAANVRKECIQNVLQQYEGFGTEHQGVEYVKQRIVDAIKARGKE